MICKSDREYHEFFHPDEKKFSIRALRLRKDPPKNKILLTKNINNDNSSSNLLHSFDTSDNILKGELLSLNKFKYLGIEKLIEMLNFEFEGKNLCKICYSEEFDANNFLSTGCSHLYCMNCWKKYITLSIITKKKIEYKCMDPDCTGQISQSEFKHFTEENLIGEYEILKKKNFFKIFGENNLFCIFPNCCSIAIKKNKKIAICENSHKFCHLCKNLEHKGKCIDV